MSDGPGLFGRIVGSLLAFAGAFVAAEAATVVAFLMLAGQDGFRLPSGTTIPFIDIVIAMAVGTAICACGRFLLAGVETDAGFAITMLGVWWLTLSGSCFLIASDVGLIQQIALMSSPIGALLIAIGQTLRR